MHELEIVFKCIKCDHEDIPENFHGIQQYAPNNPGIPMRMIYVQCPNCGTQIFFTHFAIHAIPEPINFDEVRMSMGHETPNRWQKDARGLQGSAKK